MWYQSSSRARSTPWEFWMAPKKNRKQVQETMLEEPTEKQVVPPKSIGEEEPRTREDQDEPESEEEQRSLVLFTQEQLEALLKMNRPDFSELVAPSREEHPRMQGCNRPNLGSSMVPATERLWMHGL
jgi:hypothetical protein